MASKNHSYLIMSLITKNHVIKGTLILTIAGFATRIIGFYNRIFLSGLIGAKEMGIYQLIFPIYMLAFSISTFGNELALTKLVSEYADRKEYKTVKSFFYTCLCINLCLGICLNFYIYQNANWISLKILNAPECEPCLKILSFSISFMAGKGAIHGYFLGLKKSSIHGISDFLEQTAKILGIYILSTYFCIQKQYDASFAVWGIFIADLTSFIYSVIAYFIYTKRNYNLLTNHSKFLPIHKGKVIKLFLKDSIPLTVNRLVLTILQSIESILILNILLTFYYNSDRSLATYGVFSGMAFPFIMFPSTITNSLSTMLLPTVSSANSRLEKNYLINLCEKSIHFCMLIGIFSTCVFYIWGPSIGNAFFQNKEAGHYLFLLSLLCPFIYLVTTLVSILNGLGLATYNLFLTVISTIIRISFILFLIPKIGIIGYIVGLFFSYLFLTYACLHLLQKHVCFTICFKKSILIPAIYFFLSGNILYNVYQHLCFNYTSIATIVFLIFIILLFCIVGFLPFLLQNIFKK